MNHRLYFLKLYYDIFSSKKDFKNGMSFKRNQWLTFDELTSIQSKKLLSILKYAANYVPSFSGMKEVLEDGLPVNSNTS